MSAAQPSFAEMWDELDRARNDAAVWAMHANAELAKAKVRAVAATGEAKQHEEAQVELWRAAARNKRHRALRFAEVQKLLERTEKSEAIRAELDRLAAEEAAASAPASEDVAA